MKHGFAFLGLSVGCVAALFANENFLMRFVAASAALAFLGVALAYGFSNPKIFLKRLDGRISWLSFPLFWPFHALNFLSFGLFRLSQKENDCDEIAKNVLLGRRFSADETRKIAALNLYAVLDLTAEFGEIAALQNLNYRCIPVLDLGAPTAEELRESAKWIATQAEQGQVYVHCALGHGRSATFVAAYLLHCGQSKTADAAVNYIAARRPKIGLSDAQMKVLRFISE